jgi:hypothetical protein
MNSSRSRIFFVQSLVLAIYLLCPVLLFTADRVMTSRFVAINDHLPDLSNYALAQLAHEVSLCGSDRTFSQCAHLFSSEHSFVSALLVLLISLITLLIASVALKQKRFAIQLVALLAFYITFVATMDSLLPLSSYYMVCFGR